MKNLICITASLLLIGNIVGQNATRMATGNFTEIDVNSSARVNLHQADSNYVTITSKDSMKKFPKWETKDGVLDINSSVHGTYEVYVKNLSAIKVSDASRVECKDTLKCDHLTVHASDAGRADILVHANYIKVHADDAGNVSLAGSTDSLEVKVLDASHVNADNLRTGGALVNSSDGSNATVRPTRNVDAKATDGSIITIMGKPSHANTSATDGGSVKMNETGVETTQWTPGSSPSHQDSIKQKKQLKISADLFLGGGFITGGSNGADIKYGNSREFIVGLGHNYKFVKWDAVGWGLYYKSTDYYLAQNASKTFPEATQYQSEKVSTQNFGALIYDRIYFAKHVFLEGGVYGDWAFHSKHIIWETNPGSSSTDKIKTVNLSYVNPFDYGLTFRLGVTKDVDFYFNYRLSKLFQNDMSSGQPYPVLPAYTAGVMFDL